MLLWKSPKIIYERSEILPFLAPSTCAIFVTEPIYADFKIVDGRVATEKHGLLLGIIHL